ncbi:MAG: class I SAM-dependent methyltransferase [Bryobacterales bacterium]|nr:class I SAM-dependent methyltransferase [Bryobacteraceae bacterium]MDW8354409.1 class I SAM-dependent methyltransferase [Bryobacterales bacterium]
MAPRWDELSAAGDAQAVAERFVAESVTFPARRILDAGCGTGILLATLRRSAPHAQIVEFDLAESMLLCHRGRDAGSLVDYVCGDALHPPFAPGAFDVVLCFGVLPHLAPIEAALRELLACLRPGGLLSIGHAMGSAELNAFHATLDPVVAGDRLPKADELASMLRSLGAIVVRAEEAPDRYFVQARSPS